MRRSNQRVLGTVLAATAFLAVGGCGAQNAPSGTTAQPPNAAAGTNRAAADAPTASARPQGPPSPPATASGSLTKSNLPSASGVGPDFQPYVEPDSPDEGIVSNGSSVHARDPKDVAAGLVPLGCPGVDALAPLPVPVHALEETYRTRAQLSAVALTLEYASDAQAGKLVDGLAAMLATCTPPSSAAALSSPRLVADVRRPDANQLFDTRAEIGPAAATTQWDETVVRHGKRVSLVIVERPATAKAHDQSDLATDLNRRLSK